MWIITQKISYEKEKVERYRNRKRKLEIEMVERDIINKINI